MVVRTISILSVISAMLVTPVLAIAAPAAVDGAWSARVPGPNGQQILDVVFVFRMDGAKLTGTASANGSVYDLVDTKVDGSRMSFAIDGETNRYTGTLAGDEIKMDVTYNSKENGARTWSFVAKRQARSPGTGQASSVEGEWRGDVPRGGGQFIPATFELHLDGTTLSGRVLALNDEYPVTNGTMTGGHLSFVIGTTKGSYSGEVDGDTLRMKVKYDGGENGRLTLDFVLTRVRG